MIVRIVLQKNEHITHDFTVTAKEISYDAVMKSLIFKDCKYLDDNRNERFELRIVDIATIKLCEVLDG